VRKLITILLLSIATTIANGQDTITLTQFITKWIGKPYRYGGNNEKGIDCSAFVKRLYKDVYNIIIPRTTKTQLKYFTLINISLLQIGDVLFFNSRTSPSGRHVGVYIGNDEFIHAANYRDGVKISCLEGHYLKTLIGVGRL
jgi:cell wall-associated NlpC family hydrolase